MPGGRTTHRYPHGIPIRLRLAQFLWPLVFVLCVWIFPSGWQLVVALIVGLSVSAIIYNRIVTMLERSGDAVPVPRKETKTEFPGGLPKTLFILRAAFFSLIMIMFIFGLLKTTASERGIIG